MVTIKESEYNKSMIGIYAKDEFGHPEEILSLTLNSSKKLVKELLEFIKKRDI